MQTLFARAAAVAAVLALSGLAAAQGSQPGKPAPRGTTPPTKTTTPAPTGDKKPDAAKPGVTLKAGDKAPAFTVETFVKGDEVKSFEKGKIYVVEFWATWCGPCKASIPHLTELQHKHKDVAFIGVASSERNSAQGGKDTRLDTLKNFVKGKGDEMDYRVAYDGKAAMAASWMRPAGQNGIPCAFIVDGEGKIAWIGHPDNMEEQLDKAIAANTPKTETPTTGHPAKPAEKPKS